MAKKATRKEYRAQGIYKQVAPTRDELAKDRLKANKSTEYTLLFAPKRVRVVTPKTPKLR